MSENREGSSLYESFIPREGSKECGGGERGKEQSRKE